MEHVTPDGPVMGKALVNFADYIGIFIIAILNTELVILQEGVIMHILCSYSPIVELKLT